MKKFTYLLLLLSLSSVVLFSGCRRKPIEQIEIITETESESETEIETETESETETEAETKKAKNTKKQTTQKEKTKTEKETDKKTVTPSTPANPSGTTSDMCPYCFGTFSTIPNGDGSSEYSEHVAAEEAYIEYMKSQGLYTDPSPSANTNNYNNAGSAQCTYCWGWFSTDSTYGYSEYSQHMAMEEANAYQQNQIQYTQCPYCGLYIDPVSYQDHVTYGY